MSIVSFFMAIPYANYFFAGSNFLSFLGIVNVLAFIGVPLLGLILFLSKHVFKTRVSPNFKAGMWSFWVVNVISLFALGSYQGSQFRGHSESQLSVDLSTLTSDTLSIKIEPDPYRSASFSLGDLKISNDRLVSRHVHLNILQTDGNQFELEQRIYSRGASEAEARQLSSSITYDLQVLGNTLSLPRVMEFQTGDKWRGQNIELTLRVPEGKAVHFLSNPYSLVHHVQVDRDQDHPTLEAEQTWRMETNGLINRDFISKSQRGEEFDYTDFENLQLDGPMKVTVEKGPQFKIAMSGRPHYLDNVEVVQLEKTLNVTLEKDHMNSPVRITITMPELRSLSSNNTDDVKIQGFTQSMMRVKHDGRDELRIVAKIDSLFLQQYNRSEVTLKGEGNYLEADLDKQTELDADRYSVKKARINAGISSRAKVAVSDSLWTRKDSGARIEVDGSPVLQETDVHDQQQ